MNGRAIWTLLRYHWWRHRVPLIPMAVGLGLFELLLTRIAPAPDEVSWIAGILAAVPPQLLALIGDDIAAGSPSGFLAIGYGHPFFFLMLSIWVARVSSRVLAGEIGSGSIDLLAARPVARWVHVAAGFIALAVGLAVLTGSAWSGTAIGLAIRPLSLAGSHFLPVAAMAWLLFLAFGCVGMFVSATQRDAGSAIGWLSGLMAASFVLDYLARLWKTLAALRVLSLFAYYNPQHIVKVGPAAGDIIRLVAVSAGALAAALVLFKRRDL